MQNMSGGKTALGLDANVGALVCYLGNLVCGLGLVYSIIVLVTDKANKLPRFHAMQSILLWAVGLVIGFPCYIIVVGLAMSGSTALALVGTLIWLVIALVFLAIFVFTVISAIKAFNNEIYKVPFVGDFADKWSN